MQQQQRDIGRIQPFQHVQCRLATPEEYFGIIRRVVVQVFERLVGQRLHRFGGQYWQAVAGVGGFLQFPVVLVGLFEEPCPLRLGLRRHRLIQRTHIQGTVLFAILGGNGCPCLPEGNRDRHAAFSQFGIKVFREFTGDRIHNRERRTDGGGDAHLHKPLHLPGVVATIQEQQLQVLAGTQLVHQPAGVSHAFIQLQHFAIGMPGKMQQDQAFTVVIQMLDQRINAAVFEYLDVISQTFGNGLQDSVQGLHFLLDFVQRLGGVVGKNQ
nr:hypothetical protein [Thiothrix sp.]